MAGAVRAEDHVSVAQHLLFCSLPGVLQLHPELHARVGQSALHGCSELILSVDLGVLLLIEEVPDKWDCKEGACICLQQEPYTGVNLVPTVSLPYLTA